MNSQPARCVCLGTQSSDTITKGCSVHIQSAAICSDVYPFPHQETFLFWQQPSVMNMSHCERDWISPAIHYPSLCNGVYILRLNVAAWIQSAPPLILRCWNITASRRITTWLMARDKSSHPVTTCQFKSTQGGLAMLQRGRRGWGCGLLRETIGGRGLASGKWEGLYWCRAGWGRVKHVGRGGMRLLCRYKEEHRGEWAALKRN